MYIHIYIYIYYTHIMILYEIVSTHQFVNRRPWVCPQPRQIEQLLLGPSQHTAAQALHLQQVWFDPTYRNAPESNVMTKVWPQWPCLACLFVILAQHDWLTLSRHIPNYTTFNAAHRPRNLHSGAFPALIYLAIGVVCQNGPTKAGACLSFSWPVSYDFLGP